MAMSGVLEKIVAVKRDEVAAAIKRKSLKGRPARRFHSGRHRAELCRVWCGVPVCADRLAVFSGLCGLPQAGARFLPVARVAQGFHDRCVSNLRVARHGGRLRLADCSLSG